MRIALIADTHLSARSPECVANWHAARRAVGRLGAAMTVHLGDITLDGCSHPDELAFAARLMHHWPTEIRCVPGNHDVGSGSGEAPLDMRGRAAYVDAFGSDCWTHGAGTWRLVGIDAQLLGSGTRAEAAQWAWLDAVAAGGGFEHTALFLHRPLLQPAAGAGPRRGRYVDAAAAARLLEGPLQRTLRLVVSGHMHQFLDASIGGVRHLWMPSSAFVIPDEVQERIGDKLVGIGLLTFGVDSCALDLWCPDGMQRHDLTTLRAFAAAGITAGPLRSAPRSPPDMTATPRSAPYPPPDATATPPGGPRPPPGATAALRTGEAA